MIGAEQLAEAARRIVAAHIPDQRAHDRNDDAVARAHEVRTCEDALMTELGITRRRAATAIVNVMRERRGQPPRWGGRRAGAGAPKGAQGPRLRQGDKVLYGHLGGNDVHRGEIQAVTRYAYWIKLEDGTLFGIERMS